MSLDEVYLPPIKPGSVLRIELYNNGTDLEARVDYPASNLRLYAYILFILLICLFIAGIYFTWQWLNPKSDEETSGDEGARPTSPNSSRDKEITQEDTEEQDTDEAATSQPEEEMEAPKEEKEASKEDTKAIKEEETEGKKDEDKKPGKDVKSEDTAPSKFVSTSK
uniref:Uncharacterized protein n=1 Tax=Cacopsylla melanoneura TaxID=428564 RepID=A0A8D8WRC2_9HEMI